MTKIIEESVIVPVTNVKTTEYGGGTSKEQLENFLKGLFKKYGVCNIGLLKQHLTERQKDKGEGITEKKTRTRSDCLILLS
jgi:hypothetical protein